MSTPLTDFDRFYSREEYRRWCEAQPRGRFERIDGRIVAMSAERVGHARMKFAAEIALRRAVAEAGIPCEALPDGVTVETGENDYEPDALVNCGPPIASNAIAAPNPVVIVEVLSPGTMSSDTGGKLAGYFQVQSVAHYLVIHPAKRLITHHRRTTGGIMTQVIFEGPIEMTPPGITITVEELYSQD